MYVLCSPGLLEELSQSSEPLTHCLSVETGRLFCVVVAVLLYVCAVQETLSAVKIQQIFRLC